MIDSLISAGANIFGGLLGRKSDKEADRWNERSHQLARESFDWNKNYIQNRVKDAQAAGIHPLYALGTPGADASFTAGGSTGSALGRGIARAGEAVASGMSRKNPLEAELIRSQIRATDAAASRDSAQAAVALSQVKRAEQEVLNVRTNPLEEGPGPSRIRLGQVPRKETHGVKAFEKYVRPDGSVGNKYTEDMQMDEAGQVVIGAQDLSWAMKRWLKDAIRDTVFGPWSRNSPQYGRIRPRSER